MGTEEIFPSLFTIVFPAKDGGVSEEDDADGNDVRTNDADIGRNAAMVSATPVSGLPSAPTIPSTPEDAMVRPVMEQTTMVSMKVPVMEM